ncbi:MAG: InlB B-repeat-containing protein [Bacteroidales bacterium]|nr:InlB B-repeat-containing protein [Bacteroidales bacterium]
MNQLVTPPHVGLKNLKHRLFAPFRRVVLAALLLCTVWAARAQNLTVKFNGYTEHTGQASLEAAIMHTGLELRYIESIEITAGDVVADDWLYLSNNTSNLSQLKHFTVTNAVNSVAPMVSGVVEDWGGGYMVVSYHRIFGNSIETVSVAKTQEIGCAAFSGCINLTSVSFPHAERIFAQEGLAGFSRYYPAFADCSKLTEMHLGATPPEVYNLSNTNNTVTSLPLKSTFLCLVDDNGNPLTGSALSNAIAAYRGVDDGDLGDNLWYGVYITKPPLSMTLTIDGNTENVTATSIEQALENKNLNQVEKIIIDEGALSAEDWNYLGNKSNDLNNLSNFTCYSKLRQAPIYNNGTPIFGKSLKKFHISSPCEIGEYAFKFCDQLSDVRLDKAERIGSNAFLLCAALREISLPQATCCEMYAFQRCTSLEKVKLPRVEKLASGVFLQCCALKEVHLPASPPKTDGDNICSCTSAEYTKPTLFLVNYNGNALSGDELIDAIEAYKADENYDAATNTWAGCLLPQTYTLSLRSTGGGGFNSYCIYNQYCGFGVDYVVLSGDERTIEAYARPGYHFVRWISGSTELNTSRMFSITVTSDTTIIAEFELNVYSLIYTAGEGGSIQGQLTQTVQHGGSGEEVEAEPNDGYRFVKWSDEVTTAKRTDSNVQGDISVTAIFELIPTYTLTYTATMGGSISGTTTQTVREGESGSEVEAVAAEGFQFLRWSDGLTTTKRTDSNVRANLSVQAEFIDASISIYTLTYTATEGGSITGATTQAVQHGGSGTEVEAVPNAGYRFVQWSDGLTTAKRTDSNVNADISAEAQFAIISYTLSYTASEGGSISGQATQTVQHGGSGSEVEAVAQEGYRFVKWSDGRTTAKRTDYNVQGNLTVTAEFEKSNTTGLLDTKLDALSVYPNPTQGVLWVSVPELAEGTAAEVHVYNANGQLLQRVPAHGASAGSAASRLSIDLSGDPAGVYIIRVGNAVAKVVKQ